MPEKNSGRSWVAGLGRREIAPQPNPDHAWKALGLVNEWIRHADAKAGATLAFTGVMAALLFNLVKDFTGRTPLYDILVVATCVLLLAAVILCGVTLAPQVRDHDAVDEEVNRLFFGSIAKHYKGQRPEYRDVLHTLTADPASLTRDLADQIHANAGIASRKSAWVTWAIRSAFLGGVGLAGIAATIALSR